MLLDRDYLLNEFGNNLFELEELFLPCDELISYYSEMQGGTWHFFLKNFNLKSIRQFIPPTLRYLIYKDGEIP